ncbi:hypothetical protein VTO73DRAFT_13858 [Trametes versicolor]
MASTTSAAASMAAFLKSQDLAVAERYFKMATTMLLMWHYLLTIDKEVAFFWRRRFSGVCALFLANRYIILVVIIYQSPWWNVHFSQRWQWTAIYLQTIFAYMQYLVWAVFSFLRVYALQMRWECAVFVLILSLGHVAYGIWVTATEAVVFDTSPNSCHSRPPWSAELNTGCELARCSPTNTSDRASAAVAIAARAALVLAEMIVMAVAWSKMSPRRHRGDIVRVPYRPLTLSSVFYENGRIFFLLMLVAHTVYLVNRTVTVSATTTPALLYFVQFGPLLIEPTIGILVNHFLISLQEAANRRTYHFGLDTHPHLATSDMAQDLTRCRPISLVQFARADVDEWLEFEGAGAPPALADGGAYAQWEEECIEALKKVQARAEDYNTDSEDTYRRRGGAAPVSSLSEFDTPRLRILSAQCTSKRVSLATTSTTLLYFVNFSPLLPEPTIGILVSHVLIALHASASTHDHPLLDGDAAASRTPFSLDTHGSVSLVQFARADVDSWARAEPHTAGSLSASAGEEEPQTGQGSVAGSGSHDVYGVLDLMHIHAQDTPRAPRTPPARTPSCSSTLRPHRPSAPNLNVRRVEPDSVRARPQPHRRVLQHESPRPATPTHEPTLVFALIPPRTRPASPTHTRGPAGSNGSSGNARLEEGERRQQGRVEWDARAEADRKTRWARDGGRAVARIAGRVQSLALVIGVAAYAVHAFSPPHPSPVTPRLAIASRVSLVVPELTVLVVTWMKMKDGRRSGPSLTLSNVFYQNGRVYFAATKTKLRDTSLSILRQPEFVEFSIVFVEPLIGISVSRFLISLQEAAFARTRLSEHSFSMSDDTSGAGSMSVLELIRADVDERIQSEAAASPVLASGARGWSDPTVQWDEA